MDFTLLISNLFSVPVVEKTTAAAAATPVNPSATPACWVEAEARVRPSESSTTWAEICLLDRNTTRRGRAGVPVTVFRMR